MKEELYEEIKWEENEYPMVISSNPKKPKIKRYENTHNTIQKEVQSKK